MPLSAVLWSDYLCPWCYLGRATTRLLRDLDVDVTVRPYELHPELPIEGKPIRGERSAVYRRIAAECAEVDLEFKIPDHLPNSRLALEAAAVVAASQPESFAPLDDALFDAYWVQGRNLGDVAVISDVLTAAGVATESTLADIERGRGAEALKASMATARSLGITAVPSWWIDDVFLLPGTQDASSVTRWVTKLAERAADSAG